ncbi:MAG: hypothetical protein AUG51_20425 [Acidobacteria bacterium 13_1_20CM_3_53_8]|nr:MAG: hypothetical protein AUG51_20425 [Acidobacteria bacterium 13_1_20CM_3_53_8]
MTQEKTLVVRVLFLREGDSYVAQCLEYDIAAQGKTMPEVKRAFELTLAGQMELDVRSGKQPFEGIPKAPDTYWEMFDKALKLEDEEPISLPKGVPPPFVVSEIVKELRVF